MEFKQLRYFIAVAEEGHITRAAERLDMQQPPLSRQIKAIERELDVQLFYRTARGVELTDAGRAFLDEARTLLANLQHAFDATRSVARGERGRISVGVMPTGPFHPFVPQVIRRFREAFPLVSLTLEERLSTEMMDRLRDEQMDVAFIRTSRVDPEHLAIIPLLDEPMMVAVPEGHQLIRTNGEKSLSMKQLARETFILFGPPGTGMYDATIAACRGAGFSPRVGQQAPGITSCLGLVAVGLGIALVPASMQRTHMEGLLYRRIAGPNVPTVQLSLGSRRGNRSAVVRNFLQLVKKAAKELRS
ncbi:LysR family transcriptional regulator [Bradyrhizobium ganzhouense]|uniref:LysR family transcriptional regulator n=1 Tax=Bradyrhizobium ganzhouense TaxID=1179767 RepID=UPI003CECC7C8